MRGTRRRLFSPRRNEVPPRLPAREAREDEVLLLLPAWENDAPPLLSLFSHGIMQSSDNVYNLENVDAANNLKDDLDSVDSSVVALAERVNFASSETSREGEMQDLQDLEGPLASAFPSRPLQALKYKPKTKWFFAAFSFLILLFNLGENWTGVTAMLHEEPSEGKIVQRKGRFQITFPDASPKVLYYLTLW
ncbi:hypothetical protein BHE74_00041821 [Ensete ventricosum]|nr:hypothetical protein BHE74_00041821 [Ensete ventricosum]